MIFDGTQPRRGVGFPGCGKVHAFRGTSPNFRYIAIPVPFSLWKASLRFLSIEDKYFLNPALARGSSSFDRIPAIEAWTNLPLIPALSSRRESARTPAPGHGFQRIFPPSCSLPILNRDAAVTTVGGMYPRRES